MPPTATPHVAGALRADVATLAAIERPPCSPGEREAAEWIAARLRACGARVAIDEEPVHGTYFWPMTAGNLGGVLGGVAALRGRRRAGALLGGVAAAALAQDLSGGRRRALRGVLPKRPTWNVVAELGDPQAAHTLVVHAHHDAARTSFIFDPTVPRLIARHASGLHARMDRWPPLMGLVAGGPAAVAAGAALGSRRLTAGGTLVAAAAAAVMAHMSRQAVVPGANDNLTGVAVLLEVARRLERSGPPAGVRVILLSAGAEEGNQAGMLAFLRRHRDALPCERTSFLCLDTVGSPDLVLIEGEGFLRMREYPHRQRDIVGAAARDAGVRLKRGFRFTFATDGLVPLREGYEVASVGSMDADQLPSNYHWPTDTAENVDYATVSDAVALTMATIARCAPAA
ncbi:MAG TPA: M28 family peptidase [Baekduia sp.]|nr:M28 family peptidase [Baekduia sp.]